MKKIILAVDDMPEALASINAALKEIYDIRCVTDVKSARAALETITPSLLLLDIEMPGVSGLEFLDELQHNEKFKNIPVVFLTANSEDKTSQKAVRKGAKGYIIKPFTPEILRESVAFFS
ncbi:MAG: response regulator [Spirochaetaceae bacterium]|nr:response regulator [Spirochaetaceae bacterium]